MIVDLIVGGVLQALSAIFGLAPEWSPPSSQINSGLLSAVLTTTERFFPISTLVTVGAIAIGFRLLIGGFHLAVWLYEKFPFKAT